MTQEFYPVISVAFWKLHNFVIPSLPIQSQLSQLYGQKMESRIDVKEGQQQTWSPCVHVLEGHTGSCFRIAFSPDGGQLVSGSSDHTIHLWNMQTGALLEVMTGHSGPVLSLAYSPNGMIIASGSQDDTVRLWDATTGLQIMVYTGHSSSVWCVTFSIDGLHLASGGVDGKVHIWSKDTANVSKKMFETQNHVISLAYIIQDWLMVT